MKNPFTSVVAIFKNTVLYAEIISPYATKIMDPTMLMILIIKFPLSVDDLTVIDNKTKMEPTRPIISVCNIFNILSLNVNIL